MEINACVKKREPSFYLKKCSPIALLFKYKGGLANHPLSCHPQGVFGSRESGRKGEKMRENKRSGKTHAQFSVLKCKNEKVKFSIHSLGLINAQRRANLQKYLNYLQYRKGILGKITKTWSKGG